MGVIVALDNDGEASGTLFWDDGEALGKDHYVQIISRENLFRSAMINFACVWGAELAVHSTGQI